MNCASGMRDGNSPDAAGASFHLQHYLSHIQFRNYKGFGLLCQFTDAIFSKRPDRQKLDQAGFNALLTSAFYSQMRNTG
jgi:hypothetical protein